MVRYAVANAPYAC